jgi:hypothetical protein
MVLSLNGDRTLRDVSIPEWNRHSGMLFSFPREKPTQGHLQFAVTHISVFSTGILRLNADGSFDEWVIHVSNLNVFELRSHDAYGCSIGNLSSLVEAHAAFERVLTLLGCYRWWRCCSLSNSTPPPDTTRMCNYTEWQKHSAQCMDCVKCNTRDKTLDICSFRVVSCYYTQ